MSEKLFYILLYFKCYPTFDVAGILFDFDRSQANRWMRRRFNRTNPASSSTSTEF